MLSDRNLMPFPKRSPCISKLYIYAILAARRYIGKNMGTHTCEIGSESSAKLNHCWVESIENLLKTKMSVSSQRQTSYLNKY